MNKVAEKKGDIKLVVTDLDDTLLAPDRTISFEAINTINALKEKSVAFTFITGRPIHAIHSFATQVEITAPIIACNGACLVNISRTEILAGTSLDVTPLDQIVATAKEAGLTVLVSTAFDEFALSHTEWTKIREDRGKPYEIRRLSDFTTENVFKVTIINATGNLVFHQLTPLISSLEASDAYSVSLYEGKGCEIVAHGVDKGLGLTLLCEKLGVTANQVLAIGDNVNDVPMIQKAGIGVAVQNAVPALKAVADYVTNSCSTKGVIEAIDRYAVARCTG